MNTTVEAALKEGFTHPIRDVLWGHIYMTEELAKLTESPPFIRLTRILQLGPVFMTYPGATHTRASHSIGVYHIGRRLLENLCERGASQWLTPQGVKSFLTACLLHDLGHFPYTHSLKELSLKSHEALTAEIILKEPMKTLVAKTGADPDLTAAIIDKDISSFSPTAGAELSFYRKLLSGALDPDKLDYLNRDARYCGVPYGAQDVDFILSRLHPHQNRGADIDSRLIPNVESILFSKYLMYRTIYWHRQVRAATAMVKKALINSLESGKICGEDLYNLDDSGLFSLLVGTELINNVREGQIYTAALEIPCDQTHIDAVRDISRRSEFEEKLAAEMGIKDIILDIPEKMSFETGLYVADEQRDFGSSSSAFKTETVNAFIQTLYTIRVFINPKYNNLLKTFSNNYDILNILPNGRAGKGK